MQRMRLNVWRRLTWRGSLALVALLTLLASAPSWAQNSVTIFDDETYKQIFKMPVRGVMITGGNPKVAQANVTRGEGPDVLVIQGIGKGTTTFTITGQSVFVAVGIGAGNPVQGKPFKISLAVTVKESETIMQQIQLKTQSVGHVSFDRAREIKRPLKSNQPGVATGEIASNRTVWIRSGNEAGIAQITGTVITTPHDGKRISRTRTRKFNIQVQVTKPIAKPALIVGGGKPGAVKGLQAPAGQPGTNQLGSKRQVIQELNPQQRPVRAGVTPLAR